MKYLSTHIIWLWLPMQLSACYKKWLPPIQNKHLATHKLGHVCDFVESMKLPHHALGFVPTTMAAADLNF